MEGTVHKGDQYLIMILLYFIAAAIKAITKNWLQSVAPDYRQWLNIISVIQTMERLTYGLKTKEDSFSKGWYKWLMYISRHVKYCLHVMWIVPQQALFPFTFPTLYLSL